MAKRWGDNGNSDRLFFHVPGNHLPDSFWEEWTSLLLRKPGRAHEPSLWLLHSKWSFGKSSMQKRQIENKVLPSSNGDRKMIWILTQWMNEAHLHDQTEVYKVSLKLVEIAEWNLLSQRAWIIQFKILVWFSLFFRGFEILDHLEI